MHLSSDKTGTLRLAFFYLRGKLIFVIYLVLQFTAFVPYTVFTIFYGIIFTPDLVPYAIFAILHGIKFILYQRINLPITGFI